LLGVERARHVPLALVEELFSEVPAALQNHHAQVRSLRQRGSDDGAGRTGSDHDDVAVDRAHPHRAPSE
jgi:hypothetical protein